MYAINQTKSITELNQLSIKLGYFLAKNVGILFLSKRDIVMEEQERVNYIDLQIAKYENL